MKKYLDLADKSEYYYLKDNAIVTKLPEIGYMEELHDEDWYEKSYIWFYGEWLGSEEANVESNLKTMAMRIRDLLKESNHAQWKEVDDFLKQYEHSKLVELCDMYQQKCPNEYKLEFDVATHKFDASYRYDDYTKSGISPVSELMSWYGEIKESM